MDDHQTGLADWVVPTVLVALGLGLFFALGLALAVAAEDHSEASPLIRDLDVYTDCLIDHGADVPRVEVRPDGGFAISVPGALVEGDFDVSAWQEAADQCAPLAPDLFGGFLGESSGDWFEVFSEDVFDDIGSIDESVVVDEFGVLELEGAPRPRRPESPAPDGWRVPPEELAQHCERLAGLEDGVSGPRINRLRRLCASLEG